MSFSERTTIAEIAALAGVSVPTVSKVIHGRPGVSSVKRTIISDLLREHAYEPRRAAPTGVIAAVFGELESPWSLALVSALESAAFDSGMGLLLTTMRSQNDAWLDLVSGTGVDGVIFAAVELDERHRDRYQRLELP
ncbi:MAG: LacI family transcriptional regulator, partial [Frondihabitans sp.]|nr:LacI family transcriptional regulator [Frondihabitans sp.]